MSSILCNRLTFDPQPASYWYLRGFDIIKLEPYVDWYNIMTYDIRESASLVLAHLFDSGCILLTQASQTVYGTAL